MFRLLRFLLVVAVLLVVAGFVFQTLFPVPEAVNRIDSRAIPASDSTTLGAMVLPRAAENPGRSGLARLDDGLNAFAVRLELIDAAEASIDLRYYIWNKDITGLLLLEALHRAADRGVRVRLLLDDNGVGDIEAELAELQAHPEIELRLFNPFVLRAPRWPSFVFDFLRLNRRMHNKSLTVDGAVSVIGGRNIGDNYFSQDPDVNFFDMDVIVLGPASAEVAEDFDRYWASASAVPGDLLLPAVAADNGALAAAVARMRAAPGGAAYERAARNLGRVAATIGVGAGVEWAAMTMVSDDPAKGQGRVDPDRLMIARLIDILPPVNDSLHLVSAYFVPGTRLTATLTGWAAQGREVRVLTNAQEATDVLPVHAGYRRYRRDLIRSGVRMHELKARQKHTGLAAQFGLVGSTHSSLHAKTFVIDRKVIFVGSFNFDPRSARLNTEMGFLIDSPALASTIADGFDARIAGSAYEVVRAGDSGLAWIEHRPDGTDTIHATEPGTSALSRAVVRGMGWLPVEWLL